MLSGPILSTPWAVACQAPLSMRFPSKNTGVACHFLLQAIFLAQISNLHLLPWQVDSLPLSQTVLIFSSTHLLSFLWKKINTLFSVQIFKGIYSNNSHNSYAFYCAGCFASIYQSII